MSQSEKFKQTFSITKNFFNETKRQKNNKLHQQLKREMTESCAGRRAAGTVGGRAGGRGRGAGGRGGRRPRAHTRCNDCK